MEPPIAELSGLTKYYGDFKALGPLDLEIPRGTVGLLGPNGAGKTTMIRVLLGLLPPSQGSAKVLGESTDRGAKALRRRVGYVPEGDLRFPRMTGVQSVAYAGRLVGMYPGSAMQRAHEVLDYVDLGEARYREVDGYSTGMRRRLKLAQALVHDPELLILDEPTEGVDPEAREGILELLDDLQELHGLQLLISTHVLPDVEERADYAVVLDDGEIAIQGSMEELTARRSPAYLVRADAQPEELAEALDAAGLDYDPLPPNMRVEAQDTQEILEAVADAGLVVRSLVPEELTLTDAFVDAIADAPGGGGSG
jgi:ABC-2 type transport system ATP-binding protein